MLNVHTNRTDKVITLTGRLEDIDDHQLLLNMTFNVIAGLPDEGRWTIDAQDLNVGSRGAALWIAELALLEHVPLHYLSSQLGEIMLLEVESGDELYTHPDSTFESLYDAT